MAVNLINFFRSLVISFSGFLNWFFNESILDIFRPYQLILFSGLILILGFHVVRLII